MARAESGHVFEVTIGNYVFDCAPDGLPSLFGDYVKRAAFVDSVDIDQRPRCCLTVGRLGYGWPLAVIAFHAEPMGCAGFHPGMLFVPDTHCLFVGGGTKIFAYDLSKPARLRQDDAECGFWFWRQHGDVVVMGAECEFAAWTTTGEKLWTTFVDPPWEYKVIDDVVHVTCDMLGERAFSLRNGPSGAR
jgi:hypothetical protein